MKHWRFHLLVPLVVIAGAVLSSCGDNTRGPYGTQASEQRDIRKAEEIYQQALTVIAKDAEKARALLREALGYDLYHGAAHNNLGVLLLDEGKLYDAADEFEWARKLMPGHPEPRVNLAITLERGGKHVDAMDAAKAALEARPGHIGAIQVLAYIQMREGMVDKSTRGHLDTIVSRTEDPTWRSWAEQQRLRLANSSMTP